MVTVVNPCFAPSTNPLEMNTQGYGAQQHVTTNQPQNSVKFVIDELTGQHQGIVQHIVSTINQRFGILQEICEGIARNQNELTNEHRRLASEAEQSRKLDEAARNEIFMLLGSRLSCLEGGVGALDSKVDLLGHEMRQMTAKLAPVEERISVIGRSMDRAVDILRDPRQLANIPAQVGVSGAIKRVSFAPSVETCSQDGAQSETSAALAIPASANTQAFSSIERDLFSPLINSGENCLDPLVAPFATNVGTDSDVDMIGNHIILPFRRSKRRKTETGIVETPLPSHSTLALSPLFNSDLSELTESEQEDSSTPNAVAVRANQVKGTHARRTSRRIPDSAQDRALVLFQKPKFKSVRSKTTYRRRRKSGLTNRKKIVSKSTFLGVHTHYGMIGCDGCSRWYHGACVNLPAHVLEDMDENQPWYCPVCPPTSSLEFAKAQPTCEAGCSALECVLGDDGYSVDGLVGRKPDHDNPPHFLWLIKWYGFGTEECTWKPTHTFDGPTLIKEFYAAAQAEGINSAYLTSDESTDEIILLNEAMNFTGTWATSYD